MKSGTQRPLSAVKSSPEQQRAGQDYCVRPPACGFMVTQSQERLAQPLRMYLQCRGRTAIGESISPGVTQNHIHVGKIDGRGNKAGRNDGAFQCHQSISVYPGGQWHHTQVCVVHISPLPLQ